MLGSVTSVGTLRFSPASSIWLIGMVGGWKIDEEATVAEVCTSKSQARNSPEEAVHTGRQNHTTARVDLSGSSMKNEDLGGSSVRDLE